MGSYEIDIRFQGYCPRLSYWKVFYQACAIFRVVDRADRQFSMVNDLGGLFMGTEFSVLFVSLVHSCARPQSTPLRLHLLFF